MAIIPPNLSGVKFLMKLYECAVPVRVETQTKFIVICADFTVLGCGLECFFAWIFVAIIVLHQAFALFSPRFLQSSLSIRVLILVMVLCRLDLLRQ